MSYLTFAYLPVLGRYFSSRCSSRTIGPPVAQLMVVSCVPIATRMVSVGALTGAEVVAAGVASCLSRQPTRAAMASSDSRLRQRMLYFISFPGRWQGLPWRLLRARERRLCAL